MEKWIVIFFDKRGEVYDKAVVVHETLEQSVEDINEHMKDIHLEYAEGIEEDDTADINGSVS